MCRLPTAVMRIDTTLRSQTGEVHASYCSVVIMLATRLTESSSALSSSWDV